MTPQSQKDRLQQLFTKYFEGTLSESEKVEFAQLVESSDNIDVVENVIVNELLASDETTLNEDPALDAKATAILQKVITDVSVVPINRRRRRMIWVGWAAASVIAIGFIGYLVFAPVKPVGKEVAVSQEQNFDLLPGRQNAILTLSDGSTLNLDSAKDGNIAEDGSALISKHGERLVYNTQSGAKDAILYNTISTPRGNEYKAVLSDGTKVWLNAESAITFPAIFSGNERHVKISGEVYFEVAPDKKVPFTVSFGKNATVKVLGTSFNINSYADEDATTTTLQEGSIQIAENGKSAILQPRDQAVIRSDAPMKIFNDVDVDAVVSWKDGYFDFENADIKTIMRQLSRWYDLKVDYQGNTGKHLFTGQIKRSLTLASVLKILEKTKVRYQMKEGRNLIIMPS